MPFFSLFGNLPLQTIVNEPGKTLKDVYYAIPRVAGVSLFAALNVVQGIYAKHYGLDLITIASVILIARLFDAITDPLIGILSDHIWQKSGTRKPLIIIGALMTIISGYFLFSPPPDVDISYFMFWFMSFYLGYTLFEIPHLAWGGEISNDTHAKTQTFNLRTAAGFAGLALFYSIPLLPIWESREITPAKLQFASISAGLLMLPLLYLCMKKVPSGTLLKTSPNRAEKLTLSKRLLFVTHNKPLLLFLSAFIFSGVGLGMWYGLIFIFIDTYLGKGHWFAEIYLISFVAGIFASLAWIAVSKRIGKRNSWIIAMLLGLISFQFTWVFTPDNANYLALIALLLLNTLCFTCAESLPQSMLSDIVDYSTLKYSVYRGSTYFSLYLFTYKAVLALGGAVGLAIAGWYGFDPSSTTHTTIGVSGLKLAMVWLPSFFGLISILFIVLSPITAKRHAIIRRGLNRRNSRLVGKMQYE